MRRILHISDLHFGPPYRPEVGEALLAIAPSLEPGIIVASGDFTQRAKPEQFAEARAFLDKLPTAPKVVVPGNHDTPLWRVLERVFDPRGQFKKHMSEQLDQVHDFDDIVIVSLDSTSPRRAISNGRIHLDQLEFCEKALQDVGPEKIKIIVAHHHFAPAPDFERDQVMPKAKRALDRFTALGVDMIMGGHLHRAYVGNSLNVYRGADPDHGIIIVQSGTSTSSRGRGPEEEKNSFNLVILDNDTIQVTHYTYLEHDRRFEPISCHLFPRPGTRFTQTVPDLTHPSP